MESYQSGSDPAAEGKPRNTISRIFHFIMVLIYLTLLVLALVSLGTFATQHNKFRKDLGGCLLFDSKLGEGKVNKSHVCAFVIWGEAIVAVLAVVLGLLAVVKMVIGRQAVSILAVGELVTIIIGTLLGLTIGIVISIGLNQTCDAVKSLEPGSSCKGSSFYKDVHTSEVTAWIGTGVMFLLGLVYIGILIVYCIRASNRRKTETFQPPTEPPLADSMTQYPN